jgi:hypothetical protein
MTQLKSFSDQATPVLSDLGAAGPSLNQLNLTLGPFSQAADRSFTSLGDATAKSTAPLLASDPVIRQLRNVSTHAASPSRNLKRLLKSLQTTGGYKQLLSFIYNSAGTTNAYDQYGHFLRAELVSTSCVDYATAELSGCGAHFALNNKAKAAPTLASQLAAAAAANAGSPDAAGDGTQPISPGSTGGASAGAGTAKGLAGIKHVLNFVMGNGASAGTTPGAGAQAPPARKHRHHHRHPGSSPATGTGGSQGGAAAPPSQGAGK